MAAEERDSPFGNGAATGEPRGEDPKVVPFRRHRLRRRRRYSWIWRWSRHLFLFSLIVGIPCLLVLLLLISPSFALQDVEVEVGDRVSEEWVRNALRPFVGQNLFRLSFDEVRETLLRNPWARGTDLRKQLPDRLLVRVVSKRPIAVLRDEGQLYYLDEKGFRIAPYLPEPGTKAPVVVGSGDPSPRILRSALALLEEIEHVRDWGGRLSEIESLDAETHRLYFSSWPFSVIVHSGKLGPALARLDPILPELVRRHEPVSIDLRWDRRILVQPSEVVVVEDGEPG